MISRIFFRFLAFHVLKKEQFSRIFAGAKEIFDFHKTILPAKEEIKNVQTSLIVYKSIRIQQAKDSASFEGGLLMISMASTPCP